MSLRLVKSTELGKVLCRLIDIDPDRVKWLRVTLDPSNLPVVELEVYVSIPQLDAAFAELETVTKRYVLHEVIEE